MNDTPRSYADLEADNVALRSEVARLKQDLVTITQKETERQRLYNVLMQAPALINVFRGPDHIFELANPPMNRVLGNRDLIGKPVREAQPELAGQGIYELLDRVYASGVPFYGSEISVLVDRHNDGRVEEGIFNFVYQPLRDTAGQVEGIISFAYEVTDQVLAKRQAENLAAQLHTIIEAMADGVFVFEKTGQFVTINKAGLEMVGVASPTELGATQASTIFLQATYPDGKPIEPEDSPVTRALAGHSATDFICVFQPAGGSLPLYVQDSYAPIRDSAGTITGAVLIVRDITTLHKLARQRETFLSMAVHELRTPLTVIKGMVQIVQRNLVSNGQTREATRLGHADKQITRLTELITELTELRRIEAGRFEIERQDTDMTGLVRQTVEDIAAGTNSRKFKVQVPPECHLEGDANRLTQVLTNLVTNAIKYSPNDSTIWITLSRRLDRVIISVRDQGLGIPAGEREVIFDLFYRADSTSNMAQGLGLGLYISQEIVVAHGGKIWVDAPDEGQGSIFYVELPVTADISTSSKNLENIELPQ